MEFSLLGPVELVADGLPVPIGPPQRRAVAAALLVDANRPVSAETLIDRVWDDAPPPEVRGALHSHIARIRTVLARAGGSATLSRRSGGYVLETDQDHIDLFRFLDLLERARTAGLRDGDRAALLHDALALWRGEPLTGITGSWAEQVRAGLDARHLATVQTWARLELRSGGNDAVIARVNAALARHPLAEPLIATQMRALFLAGRAAEALSRYAMARRRLSDDLGTEPGPELREMYESILRGEPRRRRSFSQLPADIAAFTGRQAELETLDLLIDSASDEAPAAPVVVVSGTAGVGKTALILRWAHRVADRFPDGRLYVDLRGYDLDRPLSAGQALAVLLRMLGVEEAAIPPDPVRRATLYRAQVDDRRILVVLDNVADVEQVRPLLPNSPSCFTVVTSRDSLAALVVRHGARRLEVDLLPTAEALDLLGRLIGPRITEDHETAAALVERCVGLPLALRLVAEYLLTHPHTTPGALVAELADEQRRLDVLDAGGEERTAVRTVFSWSCRLLPGPVARAFRLLSLHSGTDIDEEAVAALVDAGLQETKRLLDLLVRAHLVQEVAPGRVGMHDLLRAYARERLAEESAEHQEDAMRRLVDHYLAVATTAMDTLVPHERHRRPRPSVPIDAQPGWSEAREAGAWLAANRANLVAVGALAVDQRWWERAIMLSMILWRYLDMGAHYADALELHGYALEAALKQGDRRSEAEIRRILSVVSARCGRLEEAVEQAGLALTGFTEGGDRQGVGQTLAALGAQHLSLGAATTSRSYSSRALEVFEELGDGAGVGMVLGNLAGACERQGSYDEAIAHSGRAVEILTEVGDAAGAGRTLGNLGTVLERLGRYGEALDHYRRCLETFEGIGVRQFEGRVLGHIASMYMRQGLLPEALGTWERALVSTRDVGDREGEGEVLDGLGTGYRLSGRHADAIDHHGRALDIALETGDRSRQASALNGLAEALREMGRAHEARTHHQTASRLARAIEDRFAEARALDGLACIASDAGQLAEARENWRKSLERYGSSNVPETEAVRRRLAT